MKIGQKVLSSQKTKIGQKYSGGSHTLLGKFRKNKRGGNHVNTIHERFKPTPVVPKDQGSVFADFNHY
jgi:hypothetical protein